MTVTLEVTVTEGAGSLDDQGLAPPLPSLREAQGKHWERGLGGEGCLAREGRFTQYAIRNTQYEICKIYSFSILITSPIG